MSLVNEEGEILIGKIVAVVEISDTKVSVQFTDGSEIEAFGESIQTFVMIGRKPISHHDDPYWNDD